MDVTTLWTALITLAASTIITTIIGLLIKRSFNNFFKKRADAEEKQKNTADKLKGFEDQRDCESRKKDMKDAIEEAITPIKQDLAIVKKGIQAGLRHDLVQMADEWLPKGYCPRTVKIDFENEYNQYHALGKNGVMDNTYQAILDLPEQLEQKEKSPVSKPRKATSLEVAEED